MKKLSKFYWICVWFLFIEMPATGHITKHVVLITIDGLRPEFYLDSSWGMVNLEHLAENGVYALNVRPVFPSVTYPDHTTIITGVKPTEHGIYLNKPFRPEGSSGPWYIYYDSIRTETLFDAMKKMGYTTASVRWPVTVGAPIDYNIPPFSISRSKDIREIMRKYVRPVNLWDEIQNGAVGTLTSQDWEFSNNELVMDENVGRIACYLIKKYKPGLIAVHFLAADHYQHQYGCNNYMVHAAVSGIDRGIKDILDGISRAGIQDSTTIIVTGDHGFRDTYRTVKPNILLKQNGLQEDIKKGKWKAQFYSEGGSTFLFLKDISDKKTLRKIDRILTSLPDSVSRYIRIVNRQEMDSLGAVPTAAMALSGLQGTSFGNQSKGKLITSLAKIKGTHGYYPLDKEMSTGFVAFGPDMAKGVKIENMKLFDIFPLVIRLMGLPPHQTVGKIYPQMFAR